MTGVANSLPSRARSGRQQTCAELKICPFGDCEPLEQGEVDIVIVRPVELLTGGAERRGIRLSDRGCHGRLSKSIWIQELPSILVGGMRINARPGTSCA